MGSGSDHVVAIVVLSTVTAVARTSRGEIES